jgi:hypothetical protein
MTLCPLTLREARAFVTAHHRHHRAPNGGMFAIGAEDAGEVVAVAIVGKPVANLERFKRALEGRQMTMGW